MSYPNFAHHQQPPPHPPVHPAPCFGAFYHPEYQALSQDIIEIQKENAKLLKENASLQARLHGFELDKLRQLASEKSTASSSFVVPGRVGSLPGVKMEAGTQPMLPSALNGGPSNTPAPQLFRRPSGGRPFSQHQSLFAPHPPPPPSAPATNPATAFVVPRTFGPPNPAAPVPKIEPNPRVPPFQQQQPPQRQPQPQLQQQQQQRFQSPATSIVHPRVDPQLQHQPSFASPSPSLGPPTPDGVAAAGASTSSNNDPPSSSNAFGLPVNPHVIIPATQYDDMAAQYNASVAPYVPLTPEEITRLSTTMITYRKPTDRATKALWEAFQDPTTGEHLIQGSAQWKLAGSISRKVCDDLLDPIYSFKQQPHLYLACRAVEEKFPLARWCEGHWKAEALLTTRFYEKKRVREKKRQRKSAAGEGEEDASGEKRAKTAEGESLENQRARQEMEEHAAAAGGVEDNWSNQAESLAALLASGVISGLHEANLHLHLQQEQRKEQAYHQQQHQQQQHHQPFQQQSHQAQQKRAQPQNAEASSSGTSVTGAGAIEILEIDGDDESDVVKGGADGGTQEEGEDEREGMETTAA